MLNPRHLILTFLRRPLPEEMFNYARSDTHFLLYIYDNMRNELIDKSDTSQENGDLIEVVVNRSKEEALQRYEHPFYDIQRGSGPMGWYNMLCRTQALFNREQFAVFRAIHQWRDQIAREEDESVHVVMPKHVLYNLAREMPIEMPTLLGCSHPTSKIFKNRRSEILAVIKKAKISGHNGLDLKEFMHTMQPMIANTFSKAKETEKVVPALATATMALPPHLQRPSSSLPAQSKDSNFWGSTVPQGMDRGVVAQVPGERIFLALPMPQLNAEVFEDTKSAGVDTNEWSQPSPGARAEHQYVKDRKAKADEVFVVRNAGGPRKRKATGSNHPPPATHLRPENKAAENAQEHADDVDGPSVIEKDRQQEQDTTVRWVFGETKEEKRAWKLRSKQLKKEGLQGKEKIKSQDSREVEPFDYADAPSVLHAQRDSDRLVTSKEINPYIKSSDAPKGVRKKGQEGKSFTFEG